MAMTKTIVELSCPTPLPAKDTILLGHGSGGKLSAELVRDIFLPALRNPILDRLDDQGIFTVGNQRLDDNRLFCGKAAFLSGRRHWVLGGARHGE